MTMTLLFYLLLLQSLTYSWSFTTQHLTRRRIIPLPAVKIDGYYDQAFRVIDECAVSGESNEKLYDAVHCVEKNGYKIYPDLSHKEALWERAHGSWKLQLSTGGAKNRSFHPPPAFLPFSFAMIAENHFGNGVGNKNGNIIWLAILHNHYWKASKRQMVVAPAQVYLFGHKVTLPGFLRRALHMGEKPEDFERPPTFVLVGASEKALIARGNQSGGLAIWTRLPQDIQFVAYKD